MAGLGCGFCIHHSCHPVDCETDTIPQKSRKRVGSLSKDMEGVRGGAVVRAEPRGLWGSSRGGSHGFPPGPTQAEDGRASRASAAGRSCLASEAKGRPQGIPALGLRFPFLSGSEL